MLNRETIIASIRKFFGVKSEVNGSEMIATFSSDGLDWRMLIDEIDDDTGNALDIDMDEADELGGNPGIHDPISPTVSVDNLVDFFLAQPVLTVERVVRIEIGRLIKVDTDHVPESYRITSPKQWMSLLGPLNRRLNSCHNCEIELDQWKELGKERCPSVADVTALALEAYTSDVA